MVSTRRTKRESLPPGDPPSNSPSSALSEKTRVTTPSSFSQTPPDLPQSANAGRLFSRSEALARMTFELNIRRVEAQVNDVQKDVKRVVQATADDKEFRDQNEARLSRLWQEMLAVRQQVNKVEASQESSSMDLEKCQTETKSIIEEFRKELIDLKEFIHGISKQMDNLPSPEDSFESGYGSLPGDRSKHSQEYSQATQIFSQSTNTKNSIENRIEETVKSTKRWNRDHKTTDLADAIFCANYLKQQSKRDPPMAVYIQKAIGKRVRRRITRSHSRPTTLEEFCQNVSWQDVLDTVQYVLQEEKQTTIKELGTQHV
ncbi:hypothetical protein ACO1O0_000597 [Amphichorda felina]